MRFALFSFLIMICFCTFAQQHDDAQNQLALLYYSKAEYQRAAEIYEKLYKETHSRVHFDYLISCYRNLSELDKAETITLEQIKQFPHNYFYQISLVRLYQETNRVKEADASIKKIERKALRNEFEAVEALQSYIELNMYASANEFVMRAIKAFPQSVDISKLRAELYHKTAQYKELIVEYIRFVELDQNELEYVQNQLQFVLYDRKDETLTAFLKQRIYSILEKKSDSSVLQELLLWTMIQEKDYATAFTLAKSLDIQEKGLGERVLELGKIANSNADYETATISLMYVLTHGVSAPFYVPALKLLLNSTEKQIFSQKTILHEQLIELETKYLDALKNLGKTNQTVDVARSLAHLQAFYLDKTTDAKKILDEFLHMYNISIHEKALCEILFADILLFEDDVWLANLQYAKVAMQYKNNDIGYEAQFKQAKLAYFNAQFEYALALLDVLKASSTKLISNDALELSQLISENIVYDPEGDVLSLFSQADLRIYQKQYNKAFQLFDSITNTYPGHSIQEFILFRKAVVAKETGNIEQEIAYLQEIVAQHSHDILAHKAHFMLALYFDTVEHNIEQAREHYEAIVTKYPNSFYLQQARNRYRELVEQ